IQQSVRRFVHDDVVRETGIKRLTRDNPSAACFRCGELTESETDTRVVIIRIHVLHAVRQNGQTSTLGRFSVPEPRLTAKCPIKRVQYVADDRVYHLLMEMRVRIAWFQPVSHN